MKELKENLKEKLKQRQEENQKLLFEIQQKKDEEKSNWRSPKQRADDFTHKAIETIKVQIDKGEIKWGFQGDEDYMRELMKNLKEFGFREIEFGYDSGFESSDPDGGWCNRPSFYYIVVHFKYPHQII